VATGVAQWNFPAEAVGHEVNVAIAFKMNCQSGRR
jgi:hypothetical protein